ncbi:MAG: AmmeMemoRadiSam system protein B [Bacteroidetes bacterium]|jgi:AmmeMemoRadiSam system protein B|nr:AmmeMemoRadiSam system protein B [Bacteroidota bacterium]
MDITSFSLEQVKKGLHKAEEKTENIEQPIRLIFSPGKIDEEHFFKVCASYCRLKSDDYNSVILVESRPGEADRKLTMPSTSKIETPFGKVKLNDKLRNDFADEDDDFFINDEAFTGGRSIQGPLMMMQTIMDDFSALLIQMTDENSYIVRELANALAEITMSHSALVIFCCDLQAADAKDLNKILQVVKSGNESGLMNILSRGEIDFNGIGTFVAGMLYAQKMKIKVEFPNGDSSRYVSGYGIMQRQPIYG